ncbi:MAG: HEAT repeat domain-containing protein [Candidatus Limnocylindrales bacterium]|jgi:hypothetical protein
MATIDELIAQLSVRAEGFETTGSPQAGAYGELQALGTSAVEPLMRALPGADPEAASSIVSLLGQAGDPRAIAPITERLDAADGNVRRDAFAALGQFTMFDLAAVGVPRMLAGREEDSEPSVREAAAALRARLGLPAPDAPWYAVAAGWEPLARAFIWRELDKPDPDFRSLVDQLAAYSPAERHAVWIGIGQEAPSRMGRTRAYLEALHNDPDPTSVAWGWLDGDYDLMGRVEHVIGPNDDHTAETVEVLRQRLGSIVEVGGLDQPGVGADTTGQAQPAVEEPVAEELPVVEPGAEEQVAEEPVAEQAEPAAAEPVAEVAAAEEAQPAAEEPVAEVAPAEEAQPAAEEPVAEVAPAEEAQPAAEEAQPAAEQAQPAAEQAQPAGQSPEVPSWAPTHFVPAGGLPAWDYPDPSRQPLVVLNPGLGLVVDAAAGDWALVRAVNGWRGWVDGRRLVGRA